MDKQLAKEIMMSIGHEYEYEVYDGGSEIQIYFDRTKHGIAYQIKDLLRILKPEKGIGFRYISGKMRLITMIQLCIHCGAWVMLLLSHKRLLLLLA